MAEWRRTALLVVMPGSNCVSGRAGVLNGPKGAENVSDGGDRGVQASETLQTTRPPRIPALCYLHTTTFCHRDSPVPAGRM
jgi:hypothetical protein